MKQAYWLLALAVVLIGGIGLGYWLKGDSNGKTAYISTDNLFAGFDMRKELNAKAELIRNARKQRLDSLKFEFDSALNRYKNAPTAAAEKFASEKRRQFLELEQQFSADDAKITQEYSDQIWKQLNQYAADYGKERGYRYIFGANGTGALMYADDSEDITKELIEYVNQKYKGVKK